MKSERINEVDFAYSRIDGEGAPVVLLHGWGCTHSTLAPIERIATAAGRPVINVDFPGFGNSTEPPTVWGVEEYTCAFEELMRREQVGEDALILGHSFGGRVGILFASRNPVGKLVLVDAAGVKPKRTMKYYFKVYSYKLKKHLLRILLGKEKAEERLNALRGKVGSSDYASASPQMRRILSKVVNEDLKHVMPLIKAPTLLIWGENDTATPIADAKNNGAAYPRSCIGELSRLWSL